MHVCVYKTVNTMLESLLWDQKKQVSAISVLFLCFSSVWTVNIAVFFLNLFLDPDWTLSGYGFVCCTKSSYESKHRISYSSFIWALFQCILKLKLLF